MGAKLDLMSSVSKNETSEKISEIPKGEKEKLGLLTSLQSTLINTKITESKIAFNSLKEFGCIKDPNFKSNFYNTCRENFLNLA